MEYQIGRIVEFNKKKWAFVSFEKSSLTVYSLETKEKSIFKISKKDFDSIYSRSSGEISQEVVDLVVEELSKKQKMIKSLKTGIKFIGSDNSVYCFLSSSRNKITFSDGKGNNYTAPIEFVKHVTDEIDENYLNFINVVQTKKEYNLLTDKEKISIALNYFRESYGEEGTEAEILELGNIIKGIAYYHEVDKYYELIGLQIKFKYKFDFQDDFNTDVGFFPIYIGRIPNYYPISFQESYGNMDFNEHKYVNGCGDELDVDKILVKKEIVNSIKF